jgi:molybdopterin-guanine dinucleotide biosynthesis protein A
MTPVGFAVAGGRSRRMGRDKALLPWGDTDLLGHALARLQASTPEVRILVGSEPRHCGRGVATVTDAAPDLGPVGGLLAALEAAPGRPALLLAVDLPLVPIALLAHLGARTVDIDVVVPVSPRGPEPLCAVYTPGCIEAVQRCVARQDLRMTAFWADVRVREIGPDELEAFGPPDELFLNVNSQEDYEQALTLGRP